MTLTERRFGAQSMTSPLREVLVKRPGPAFGRAFDDPAHGFLRRSTSTVAQREHDAFVEVLRRLGPTVHVLDDEPRRSGPRLHVRPAARHRPRRDPAAAGQAEPRRRAGDPRGVDARPPASRRSGGSRRPARSRAATRSGCGRTCSASGGRCGRNDAGVDQLAELVGGDVRIFDVPYWKGPAELIHLMSVISPVADDLAVVFLPLLPVGLWELLGDLGIRLVEVPEEEFPTLGCNVLAVRPGVVIVAEGNPVTAAALAAAGCEVHTYPATRSGSTARAGRPA